MPSLTYGNRVLDARPDRVDLRDRVYQPKLVSLPSRFPGIERIAQQLLTYAHHFVLNQGEEGACTGFGLAAVINYLQWKNNDYQVDDLHVVSPRMLYHMAQLYDEWAGEDYQGSSCRGAMKGWHRHGVCSDALWPYRNTEGVVAFVAPGAGWEQDAAVRPLGAYYRIDKNSINDLQSAIYEAGAVYCSATVHKGWYLPKTSDPVIIPYSAENVGGHAFALVGYTEDGFIIQNSWGQDWGFHGFAIISYADWVHNGTDAWVAVMGAPMTNGSSPTTFSSCSLYESTVHHAGLAGAGTLPGAGFSYTNGKVRPLSEGEAYQYTLVLGNNGVPIHRIVSAENTFSATEDVCVTRPQTWFSDQPAGSPRKLAVYAHGGLNSEADSIMRIRMMAPYFLENGIYPLFITWKTGPMESIGDILSDSLHTIFSATPGMSKEGVLKSLRAKAAEMLDRSIEAACENLLVKPMWSQMKQNASAGAESGSGIELLAAHLLALRVHIPDLEIHLAGHSAGSIVLGYLLSLMDSSLSARTLTLFAPACTLGFANRHYGAALRAEKIRSGTMHVDIMDDERELADTVGPYGKSLLYLVSRALESRHKTPLLGMAWAWDVDHCPEDQWSKDPAVTGALKEWGDYAPGISLRRHDRNREYVRVTAKGDKIRLSHGSFDNDIDVVGNMIERMRGEKLAAEIENLMY
jgi:hypothetical protein